MLEEIRRNEKSFNIQETANSSRYFQYKLTKITKIT